MTNQHTPGPWAVRPHWSDDEKFEVYPTYPNEPSTPYAQWSAIAEVDGSKEGEAESNARLIAAAPDLFEEVARLRADRDALLAALRLARTYIDDASPDWHHAKVEALANIDVAIAQAEA